MRDLEYKGTHIMLRCQANRGWRWEVLMEETPLCSGEIACDSESCINIEESEALAAEAAKLAVDVMRHNGKVRGFAPPHGPAQRREAWLLCA